MLDEIPAYTRGLTIVYSILVRTPAYTRVMSIVYRDLDYCIQYIAGNLVYCIQYIAGNEWTPRGPWMTLARP